MDAYKSGVIPMFDCRSAKVHGAIESSRSRVIWQDGKLILFGRAGKQFEAESLAPARRKGYIRAWDAQSKEGTIYIDETCWTCNGWLPVAIKSINELMSYG